MKDTTRTLLEDAIIWGKRNSGHGYSMSRLVTEALANEDLDESTDMTDDSKTLIDHIWSFMKRCLLYFKQKF